MVLLDGNEMAKGHAYYDIGNWHVSPNNKLLAFVDDTVGRREYKLRFRDLATGQYLADEIQGVSTGLGWSADSSTLLYVRKHPQTLLPYQVFAHRLGENEDRLVYEESDNAFETDVNASRTGRYVFITLTSTTSSEILLLDAEGSLRAPKALLPREENHEYRVRHRGSDFFVLTNWQARNFRLMRVPESRIGTKEYWQEVIPHREDVLLQDFEVFADHLVVAERRNGLTAIRTINLNTLEEKQIAFSEPAYTARLHANPELATATLRYSYSSLTTPFSVYGFDMVTGRSGLLKADRVTGGFDRGNYVAERHFFAARDGTMVPVSLVYRRDRFDRGNNPGYVYGYGAYGLSTNPVFQYRQLSLLDRGFVFAIIHVRGGDEMGRHWYEDGKLLKKKNTFTDFVDGTRDLIDRGYIKSDQVFAAGGSAGGLLMGVIANEVPELFLGVIAHVPFVDVITTMLDESIPLTAGEFTEWGNPRDRVFYDYMLSYSPYDQAKAQVYPHMLVTAGLYDSQVQYYEPVKWVSRLRHLKLGGGLLILDVAMGSGHDGASGRYERYRRDALEYAFILDLAGRG